MTLNVVVSIALAAMVSKLDIAPTSRVRFAVPRDAPSLGKPGDQSAWNRRYDEREGIVRDIG
jgi:hypothetical protein